MSLSCKDDDPRAGVVLRAALQKSWSLERGREIVVNFGAWVEISVVAGGTNGSHRSPA